MMLTDLIFLATETIIKDDSLTVTVQSNSSLELLGVAVAASLIGIIVGTAVSIQKDRDKEKRELVKVKDLIQYDYQKIFSNISIAIPAIERIINSMMTSSTVEDQIIARQPNQPTFSDELLEVMVNYQISFYEAIVQSGKLIMLEKKEIMAFQSFNQIIEKQTDPLEKDSVDRMTEIRRIRDNQLPLDITRDLIREQIIMFLQVRLFGYRKILDQLHSTASYFSWLNYEQSPEKIDIEE